MSTIKNKPKAVIFDVDGTLFDLRRMQFFIGAELLKYCFFHPYQLSDLFMVRRFRIEREKFSGQFRPNLDEELYLMMGKIFRKEKEKVREIINEWMHEIPLRAIKKYSYDGAKELINFLFSNDVKIVYFSDYPPERKVAKLELPFDHFFYSLDEKISCLKPGVKGLEVIVETLNISPTECVLIGDRRDKDGVMAERFGMPYSIIRKNQDFIRLKKFFSENL